MSAGPWTLGIDPSSTRTGYAILHERDLHEAGTITPRRSKDPALVRAFSMAEQLDPLLAIADRVFIEIPGGQSHARERRKVVAGLPVYGMAVGVMLARLVAWLDRVRAQAWAVSEMDWTDGQRKEKRAQRIRLIFPDTNWAKDKGLDAADAVGVAWWGLSALNAHQTPGVALHGLSWGSMREAVRRK